MEQLQQAGFTILPAIYSPATCADFAAAIALALECCADDAAALRRRGGALYGARNLLEIYPPARDLWRLLRMLDVMKSVLGTEAGLVRALYFDKPPEATWSLPWHQDRTLAVRDNRLPSKLFTHPTTKAGVPHVEGPRGILERMLTLRIHLDAATANNGPLQVLPGSHACDGVVISAIDSQPVTILANAGDVLAMRPLLSHCSGVSTPGTTEHRRIIHLEFAADPQLPDGFAWHTWVPVHDFSSGKST
jgi:hypothetical protein